MDNDDFEHIGPQYRVRGASPMPLSGEEEMFNEGHMTGFKESEAEIKRLRARIEALEGERDQWKSRAGEECRPFQVRPDCGRPQGPFGGDGMMTDIGKLVEEIYALDKKRTPGHFTFHRHSNSLGGAHISTAFGTATAFFDGGTESSGHIMPDGSIQAHKLSNEEATNNAEFLVALENAWPTLRAAFSSLEAERDKNKSHCNWLSARMEEFGRLACIEETRAEAAEAKLSVMREALEAGTMAKTRLDDFADKAWAGHIHYDARELKRKIGSAFVDFDSALSSLPVAGMKEEVLENHVALTAEQSRSTGSSTKGVKREKAEGQ